MKNIQESVDLLYHFEINVIQYTLNVGLNSSDLRIRFSNYISR